MFILLNWVKYYTKEIAKALKVTSIGAIIILSVVCIKYKPAYEVTIGETELGYIKNKEKIELKIKNYMEDTTGNIAFKEQTATPSYALKLVNRKKDLQEKQVLLAVENSTIITYKTYAVTVDGAIQTTVSSEEQAKTIIDHMKVDMDENIELNVGIVEQYSTDFKIQSEEEASQILDGIKIAKVTEYNEKKEAERKRQEAEARRKVISNKTITNVGTIAGINLARPVNGIITSRYGSRSARRSSSHTGLDIATSTGTPITPIAAGTVTYAGVKGSYGNLVIINHGNGIQSYYAHCHQIYATVGQKVEKNTVISTVGSTGNSTGPHLHLEIRQNGMTLNPENYVY